MANEQRSQLNPYLDSICHTYARWWEIYTLTDVVGRKRHEQKQCSPLLDLGLMVQTVEQPQEYPEEGKEKIERLAVVQGLRKYAPDHVLLVGRPGSGKSTALVRLLLEEAEIGRRGDAGKRRHGERNFPRVPVLLELRYYQNSVLERVQAFLQQHDPYLDVNEEGLKEWLREGRLLLLFDGFNELPSEEARQQVRVFRQDYSKTPMVFTTRDLGVGGDLNITKKLEMQPLTETQMREFVCVYLPQQGKQMLRQLGSRLRELGETPLLLWMLCSVFAKNSNQVPSNLGSVFRGFTEIYDYHIKQDVPTYKESRDWWEELLQHLAWVMTQGKSKTELIIAIRRQETEVKLTEFLRGKVDCPDDCARRWLKDLLKYHLIQVGAGNQLEFRHQLLQEYYTAESLLQRLASISDEELKWDYLNYLKWTEPLALMLELVEDKEQAVRVVRLALEVDWQLGARLAGEVKSEFQEETVGLVAELPLPQLLKVILAGITKSDAAIPGLIKASESPNYSVRCKAAQALGEIGSDVTIPELIKALEDSDSDVGSSAAKALGNIGSDAAIPELIKALECSDFDVSSSAAEALGKIGSDAAISGLIKALDNTDPFVCDKAVEALGKVSSKTVIPGLFKALQHPDDIVYISATEALSKIGSDVTIYRLIEALEDSSFDIRKNATETLGEIGSDIAIYSLIEALEDSSFDVRRSAVEALGKIGSDVAIPELVKALDSSNSGVRRSAAEALGKIGSDVAIPELVKALDSSNSGVRRSAAEALGKIGSDVAISELVKVLESSNSGVRSSAAEALGKIGSDAAIPELIKVLESSNSGVRRSAAEALGNIGSDAAIPELVKALESSNSGVRKSVVKALGNIGSDAAIPELE
ncbi:MAG: NACHT domain-containing protein, partial [Symploca sp. SIO1A3]|nr:NACHT domain-containing protein [Symploca sp. SIO1A3]